MTPQETTAAVNAFPSAAAPLIGLARLMTVAFHGGDLRPVAAALIARAEEDETDAAALMDLSTVLFLQGLPDLGLATQLQALAMARHYRLELPHGAHPRLRLLAIMAPGDLMTNTPLSFLVEDGDVVLDMLYLRPGEALPAQLPAHDLLYMAVSESDATRALLEQLAAQLPQGSVINHPSHILNTARDRAHAALQGVPGLLMPASARSGRLSLEAVGQGRLEVSELLPDGVFPLIVRPVDSHAGHGLEKVETPEALSRYLAAQAEDEFFLSRFIDYAQPDGLFRKYRVVMVAGRAYAAHMGVSAHWMIHYLNAGMAESADKREEEAAFMSGFDTGFGQRHRQALETLAERMALDYLVIDCAETPAGELLVFEVDPGAVVHRMDPPEVFAYKRPCMDRLYTAFHALLYRAAA
ncbi:RimK family alpha-L-glutamate ligase [Xylophilus rhododendri]|uniref:RimK family alpha-L-glutamate ligase n=1 Tax=Xylophilus rhododendri TaxID=2697032 RepID=A0A857IZY4_9BURK|nr:RimK family alpha-L-glutamate ligase [Xylophilus rhododendri]QHI96887.1 RimK family alpha-L-glutamate ligase [Xylophilus rhododendri]